MGAITDSCQSINLGNGTLRLPTALKALTGTGTGSGALAKKRGMNLTLGGASLPGTTTIERNLEVAVYFRLTMRGHFGRRMLKSAQPTLTLTRTIFIGSTVVAAAVLRSGLDACRGSLGTAPIRIPAASRSARTKSVVGLLPNPSRTVVRADAPAVPRSTDQLPGVHFAAAMRRE